MGFNWILLFEAYKYTTVSVATLSYYFAPIILLNKFRYSLTEKDVLLEISKTERCTARILIGQLGIDHSYMSRMLKQFEKNGLIKKTTSGTDKSEWGEGVVEEYWELNM